MISVFDGTHFTRKEFACKCGCGLNVVDAELLELLERLRQQLGAPLYINDACRCPTHNAEVGGSPKSQHMLGKAADIRAEDFSSEHLYSLLSMMVGENCGLGIYDTFVHIDVRDHKARWDKRS